MVLFAELWEQAAGPFNGACHQLGEERDEQGIGGQVTLGTDGTAIDVNGVAQGLEGIERDTNWQQQVEAGHADGQPRCRQDICQHPRQEIIVFEKEQNGQISHDAAHKPPPSPKALPFSTSPSFYAEGSSPGH